MGEWYPFPPSAGSIPTLRDGGLYTSPDECGSGEGANQHTFLGRYEKLPLLVTLPRFPQFKLQLLGLGQAHPRLLW